MIAKTKERKRILERFNSGEYPAIVTSKVLNEGINVPEANIGIVLSGSGSAREYIQRLGRLLRKREGKYAILYEVIAKDALEKGVSQRRRRKLAKRERTNKLLVACLSVSLPDLRILVLNNQALLLFERRLRCL